MYYNEEHKNIVEKRGDGYTYIGSYKCNEVTLDGKNKNGKQNYIRVKCPYCGSEYDIKLSSFKSGSQCTNCCNKYENSFAYHIQIELEESLNKYWDWSNNEENPYLIYKNSTKKVNIKCTKINYHGDYIITPNNFYNSKRCPYCIGKKVHPKDSFGQWLIDTYGDNAIEKYWSPKNIVDPFEISPQSNKKVWILCQEHEYHNDNGGYLVIPYSFYRGTRCPYCSRTNGKVHPKDSFGQWLINVFGEDAIDKYWSSKNNVNPFEIAPNTHRKIWILCQDKEYHNDNDGYEITPNKFYDGRRCPYCNKNSGKVHHKDSFGSLYPEKAKYWSKNNKKSSFEISPKSNRKHKFICEKCGEEFERSLDNLNVKDLGVVCNDCRSSQLEQLTKEILDKYYIKYYREYSYSDLIGVGNGYLRFDFYLPDYNTLIECQGQQHEEWIETWITKDNFELIKIHDQRKKDYCKRNGIKLIEIWYYEINDVEEIIKKELNLENN